MKYFFSTACTVNFQMFESCITYRIASIIKKIVLTKNSLIHYGLPPPTMPDLTIIFSSKTKQKMCNTKQLYYYSIWLLVQ